jgi:hypothetical protein
MPYTVNITWVPNDIFNIILYICQLQLGKHPVVVVQYTLHKNGTQNNINNNRTTQKTTEQHNNN